MEILIMKLKEAYEKDFILIFLRNKKESQELINILEIRNELFGSAFSFEKVRQYAEELKKEKVVKVDKNNPSEIGYSYNAQIFFESGGFVKKLFQEEKIDFISTYLIEARNKDLILLKTKQVNNFVNENDIKSMFSMVDERKIRYYIDQIRNDGYIKATASDEYFIRYYPSADKFLEEGGYAGEYLRQKLKEAELKMLNEPQVLSIEEIKSNRKLEKRKQYIDRWKTGLLYFALKYGTIALVVIIVIVIVLIILGLVTPERALSGVTWFIKHVL